MYHVFALLVVINVLPATGFRLGFLILFHLAHLVGGAVVVGVAQGMPRCIAVNDADFPRVVAQRS